MGTIGIDVGSTVAKFARVENNNSEIELYSCKLYGNPLECVKKVFEETDLCHGDDKICVTGSSRNLVGNYYHAEVIKPEIIAHVYGIQDHLSKSDMIIEIGGQDSKLILLQEMIKTMFSNIINRIKESNKFKLKPQPIKIIIIFNKIIGTKIEQILK